MIKEMMQNEKYSIAAYVKALAIANNMDAVVLDTDFNNNTAQKLYLKSGFQLAALHLNIGL